MANPFGDTPIDQPASTLQVNPFGDTASVQPAQTQEPFTPNQPQTQPQVQQPQPQFQPQLSPRKLLVIEEIKKRGLGDRLLSILEPAASVASSVIAAPIAGIAGMATVPFAGVDAATDVINALTEGLTYKPMSEAGQEGLQSFGKALKPVTDTLEKAKTGLGDPVLDVTGSPTLATAAYMVPDTLLALLSLKGLQGVRSGTVLKDSAGRPTKVLKKAFNKLGIEYENLSKEAVDAIPAKVQPKLLGSSGVDPVIESSVIKQIESGARDNGLAKLMTEYTPSGAKLKADKVAEEAIKQGIRDGQVQAIKTMNPATKEKAINMLDIMKKTKANERSSLDVRPSDIVGSAIEDRLLFLRSEAGLAKDELDFIVKHNLEGVPVDTAPVLNTLKKTFTDLDLDFKRGDAGEILRNKSGQPTVEFTGSMISKDRSAQKAIRDLVELLGEGGAPDAARLHKLKRQIDVMVDYKKQSAMGLSGAGKKALKDVRVSLNDTLRTLDPEYARVNDTLHTAIGAMDSLDEAVGGIEIVGKGSGKAMGQKMRSLMSNNIGRVKLENALDQINEATKKLGGTTLTDVKDLAHFGNILDERFGTMAKTGFAGQVEQGAAQAAKTMTQSPSKTAVDMVGKVAKTGYEKFRGINDFNAFNSLETLLRR